jgi:hypothetical protein
MRLFFQQHVAVDQQATPDTPNPTTDTETIIPTKEKKKQKLKENNRDQEEASHKQKKNKEESTDGLTKKEKRKKQKKTKEQDPSRSIVGTPTEDDPIRVHHQLPKSLTHPEIIKAIQALNRSSPEGKPMTLNELIDGLLKTTVSAHDHRNEDASAQTDQQKTWRSALLEVFGSHLHFVTPTNAQSSSVGLAWNGSPL